MKGNHTMRTKKEPVPAVDIKEARIAAMRSEFGDLTNFMRRRGYPICTAWFAMQGRIRGPKSQRIVEDVKATFGL